MRFNILSEATSVIAKKIDKKKFHLLMKYCSLMKKENAADTKRWLDKYYPDSTLGAATIQFSIGCMSTESNEHSGRPKETTSDKCTECF